jgi:hypothetical protein
MIRLEKLFNQTNPLDIGNAVNNFDIKQINTDNMQPIFVKALKRYKNK